MSQMVHDFKANNAGLAKKNSFNQLTKSFDESKIPVFASFQLNLIRLLCQKKKAPYIDRKIRNRANNNTIFYA